jgi:hypothetical protein
MLRLFFCPGQQKNAVPEGAAFLCVPDYSVTSANWKYQKPYGECQLPVTFVLCR